MNDDLLGVSPCPECGLAAMFAWDAAMNVVALELDPLPGGEWRLAEDANHIPRCAPVPAGTQLAFDDPLFSLHACPLAPVFSLADRRRQDRPETRARYA